MSLQPILFVCIGNTCRSPMAAAMVNHFFGEIYSAQSAGWAVNRPDISAHAQEVIRQKTGKMVYSLPQSIHDLDIRSFSSILVLDAGVYEQMKSHHHGGVVDLRVSDPYGGSLSDYVHTAEEILRLFTVWKSLSLSAENGN